MAEKPDITHLGWSIDQRANIQHTLLALYAYVRRSRAREGWVEPMLLDHCIAAAFSLWRAVFLAEIVRDYDNIEKAQEDFLASVISTNAITFGDDRRNSAWTVSFYLENAKHRLLHALHIIKHHVAGPNVEELERLLMLRGTNDVSHTRYEWEAIHCALRKVIKVIDPTSELAITAPTLIHAQE
jgi:hypothetical protein